ncbi:uncharacterized protein PAC_11610 [Phialocephala subalpina]|uniref:Uncharacterized protein n=1 Tax=Phialocephala subalpina TaxID=576137 RepID=A0A1L7X9K9_9HELO|nr:uncharacterized protein PAC_11610 [Phialocephala subalpina]
MREFAKHSNGKHEGGFMGQPYDVRLLIWQALMDEQWFIEMKLVFTLKIWIEFKSGPKSGPNWNLYTVGSVNRATIARFFFQQEIRSDEKFWEKFKKGNLNRILSSNNDIFHLRSPFDAFRRIHEEIQTRQRTSVENGAIGELASMIARYHQYPHAYAGSSRQFVIDPAPTSLCDSKTLEAQQGLTDEESLIAIHQPTTIAIETLGDGHCLVTALRHVVVRVHH